MTIYSRMNDCKHLNSIASFYRSHFDYINTQTSDFIYELILCYTKYTI